MPAVAEMQSSCTLRMRCSMASNEEPPNGFRTSACSSSTRTPLSERSGVHLQSAMDIVALCRIVAASDSVCGTRTVSRTWVEGIVAAVLFLGRATGRGPCHGAQYSLQAGE
jgi:hypothetical protein